MKKIYLFFIYFFLFPLNAYEISVNQNGIYNLNIISKTEKPNFYFNKFDLVDLCKFKKSKENNYECAINNNYLNFLYKINDYNNKIIYLKDESRNKIYLNVKFAPTYLYSTNQNAYKYDFDGAYQKEIKNAIRYNRNIIKTKTYRDEDNYDWYLYEFNHKKNVKVKIQKKKIFKFSALKDWFKVFPNYSDPIKRNIGLFEYNFKLNNGDLSKVPEFITIKKKNGVITINDLYERKDNSFSFYSDSQDFNRIYFWYKNFDPQINKIEVNNIYIEKNLINEFFGIDKKVLNHCNKYNCKFINVNNIKDIKNLAFHNKNIIIGLKTSRSNLKDVNLVFKYQKTRNELLYLLINNDKIKFNQSDYNSFFINNLNLKASDTLNIQLNDTKIDTINFKNIEKVSQIDKNKIISYVNKIFIFLILILIFLKVDIGKMFYFTLFILIFLLNQYYLISFIFLLIYLLKTSIIEKYINFRKIYLLLVFLFFLSLNTTSSNIVFNELLINLIYLVIIVMLYKKLHYA